jgi:GAF domain-containing protein
MEWRSAPRQLTIPWRIGMRSALHRLLRGSIPALADFGGVFITLPASIVCIASAHATPEGTRVLRALMRTYRIRRDDRASTVAYVIRTSRAVLRTDIQQEPGRAERGDAIAELHRRLAPRSAVAVPIVVRGKVHGALSLCYAHSGRSYLPRDLRAVARLATQVANVLTNASRTDGTLRLRPAAGHPRQGTTVRRRVGPRD